MVALATLPPLGLIVVSAIRIAYPSSCDGEKIGLGSIESMLCFDLEDLKDDYESFDEVVDEQMSVLESSDYPAAMTLSSNVYVLLGIRVRLASSF